MPIRTWITVACCTCWCLSATAIQGLVVHGAYLLAGVVVLAIGYGLVTILVQAERESPTPSNPDNEASAAGLFVIAGIALFCALWWAFAGMLAFAALLCCIAFVVAVSRIIERWTHHIYCWLRGTYVHEPSGWTRWASVVSVISLVVFGLIMQDWGSFSAYQQAAQHPIQAPDPRVVEPIALAGSSWVQDQVHHLWTEMLPLGSLLGIALGIAHPLGE